MVEFNKIYNENCLETMSRMERGSVDLTVTSPPYDDLREYNGYVFDFEEIAKELYRVTKDGGIVVWVVNDATIDGNETGTSFRQALYFRDVCGFNLHDTMIWQKPGFTAVGALFTRYAPVFDYMFVFSKGKIKTFNPIKDRPCKNPNNKIYGTFRQKDGSFKKLSNIGKNYSKMTQRHNVWEMNTQRNGHPAPFPDCLAGDHIISWSNKGDLVYDPFLGSGTTAKMAFIYERNYIGSELSKEYCEMAEKRIEEAKREKSSDLF